MPYLTKVFKFYVFANSGDQYYSALDERRTITIENQLLSYFGIIGEGIISGLDVSKDINDFDIAISSGMALVPFEYIQTETVNGINNTYNKKYYVAIKHEEKSVISLDDDKYKNSIVNIYISSPDNLRVHGAYSIDIWPNKIRNIYTDTSSPDAYRVYTIDGAIDDNIKVSIFVNSKEIYSGFTLNGNKVVFDSKKLPTDIITARLESKNALLLSTVTVGENRIIKIDNSVRKMISDQSSNSQMDEAIRKHRHTGASGQPSKVVLTTSTAYISCKVDDDKNTTYSADISSALNATEMESGDWTSYTGLITNINGNTIAIDNDDMKLLDVDKLKGYYVYPNIDEANFAKIISSSKNQITSNQNLSQLCSIGNTAIIAPFTIQVLLNGKEEYYGYRLIYADNNKITIKFSGSLETYDQVFIKLLYTRDLNEITGIINIDSDVTLEEFVKTIDFSGDNFKSGIIKSEHIPQLDHIGRTKELMVPLVSSYDGTDGWLTDTFDLQTYRPRTIGTNSIKNILWIEKFGSTYYLCANNTIYATDTNRLFDSKNFYVSSVSDIFAPFKMIKQTYKDGQYKKTALYAFNENFVIIKKENENWDEFVNTTDDKVYGQHQNLTYIDNSINNIYDLASDSSGRLFMATNAGLYMFNPLFSGTKNWYKLTDHNCKTVAVSCGNKYAIFFASNDDDILYRSTGNFTTLLEASVPNSNVIRVSDASNLYVGEYITISDINIAPKTLRILSISGDTILLSDVVGERYINGRSIIFKAFEQTIVAPAQSRSIFKDKNETLYISYGNQYIKIINDSIDSDLITLSPIIMPSNVLINHINTTLDKVYIATNNGVYTEKLGILGERLQNLLEYPEYEELNVLINNTNFIFYDSDWNETFFASNDGICQSNKDNSTNIKFRNSMIYLGRPLDVSHNVFKNKKTSGSIGYITNSNETKISCGERTIFVTCDLSKTVVGDYLFFTPDGGGDRVGKYFRILKITTIDKPKNRYSIDIDALDGMPLEIETIKYAETFDIIPYLNPIPIINGIPQSYIYTTNINPFTFKFQLQKIEFDEINSYKDEVIIASQFNKFVPIRGKYNKNKTVNIFLNGRDITLIKGKWSSITTNQIVDVNGNITDVYTKLVAHNTVFRGLNLSGILIKANNTQDIKYKILSNDEFSIIIDGDYASAILSGDVASNISFILDTLVNQNIVGDFVESISLASFVSDIDVLRISIKDSYIINAGELTHEELEDELSINESGLSYNFDSIRQTNLMQLFGGIQNFLTSIPNKKDNIDFIQINNSNEIIDIINSKIENSIMIDKSPSSIDIGFNVFGLYYSESHGGTYALTDSGVFFRENITESNPFPRWKKLSDLLDTINPEGIISPSTLSPSGFYIGYDSKNDKWKVSWGGFHEAFNRGKDLSNINVVAIQIDTQNTDRYYIATKEHGILKTENDGQDFRVILNYSAYPNLDDILTKKDSSIKDLKVHTYRPNVLHLLTENGLYRSTDFGENFELILRKKFDQYKQIVLNKIEANYGDGRDFDLAIGGTYLYLNRPDYGLNQDESLRFKEIAQSLDYSTSLFENLSFESLFGLYINDITFGSNSFEEIYLATNNGVFFTKTGVGRGQEYIISQNPTITSEENNVFTTITVDGIIDESALYPTNFILINNSTAAEVVSVTNNNNIVNPKTYIKVKGNVTKNQSASIGKSVMINRWNKMNNGLDNINVQSICYTNIGLICGTAGNGVYKFQDNYWYTFNNGIELSHINVSCILEKETNIYCSVKSFSKEHGGIYMLINNEWIKLNIDEDVSAFDINGNVILAGTTTSAYISKDFGNSWNKIKIPSDVLTCSDWDLNKYGVAIGGTNGAGVWSGIDFGSNWEQKFNEKTFLNDVRSAYWKIINIYEDGSDSVNPLRYQIKRVNNDPTALDKFYEIAEYKKNKDAFKNFEFIITDIKNEKTTKMMWNDQALYGALSIVDQNTNVRNKDTQIGIVYNDYIRNPNDNSEFFILFNDHQISSNNYKNKYGSIPNRNGGGAFAYSYTDFSFQGNKIADVVLQKNSLRTYEITSIEAEKDHLSNDNTPNNVLYIGTESSGVAKIEIKDIFPMIVGKSKFIDSTTMSREDNHGKDLSGSMTTISGKDLYNCDLFLYIWGNLEEQNIRNAVISSNNDYIISSNIPNNFEGYYAASTLKTKTFNLCTNFDEAIKHPYFVSTTDSEILDIVIINIPYATGNPFYLFEGFEDYSGYKFYFAPHRNINGNICNINQPFIIKKSEVDNDNSAHIYLKSYDVIFDSGNNFIYIQDVQKTSTETIIILGENIPNALINMQPITLRIQTDKYSASFNRVKRIESPNRIVLDGNIQVSYGKYCRLNYSICNIFSGSCEDLCYIKRDNVTFLNNGLEDFANPYTGPTGNIEYKLRVNKVSHYNGTLYAAFSPLGLYKYDLNTNGPWLCLNIDEKNIIDFESPNDFSIIYCATRNNLYRLSLNLCKDITPQINNIKITGIKVISSSIFISTESHGVLYSPDEGNTWLNQSGGIDITTCPQWKIAVSNDDEPDIYAYGLKSGVFKRISGFNPSDDNIFANISDNLLNKNVTDLSISNDSIYIGTLGGGVFKKTHNSNVWSKINGNFFTSQIIKNICASPNNSDIVFTIVPNQDIFSKYGTEPYYDAIRGDNTDNLYVSKDGGKSWTLLKTFASIGDYGGINKTSLFMTNDNILFVGISNNILKSSDFGATFKQVYTGDFASVNFITQTRGKDYELFASISESIILFSSDFGETWVSRVVPSPQPLLSISPVALPNVLTLTKNVVAVNANSINSPNILSGYFDFGGGYNNTIYPSSFDDGKQYLYSDFSGIDLVINGRRMSLDTKRYIDYKPSFYSPNLQLIFDQNAVGKFILFNLTKIYISGLTQSDNILLSEDFYGLFVNLYIQINDLKPLKICSYEKIDDDTIYIVAAGNIEQEINSSSTIKIGPLYNNEIQPITETFTSIDLSTSLNYFDFSGKYYGNIAFKEHPSNAAVNYEDSQYIGGYFDYQWHIHNKNQYISFSENDNSSRTDNTEYNTALDSTESILINGIDENGQYISTNKYIYKRDNGNVWNRILNNKYTSLTDGSIKNFTKINYPLVTNNGDAYLIVDDGKLLYTNNIEILKSFTASSDVIWIEKNLSPDTTTRNINTQYVKKIIISPDNSFVFMCIDNTHNSSYSLNGLWMSTNNASSWQKIVFTTQSNIGCNNVCFANNSIQKIIISSYDTSGNSCLYTNVIGHPGVVGYNSFKAGDTLIVIGESGVSAFSTLDQKASFYNDQNILNGQIITNAIEFNGQLLFICDKNIILSANKDTLSETSDISQSILQKYVLPFTAAITRVRVFNNTLYLCKENGVSYTSDLLSFDTIKPLDGIYVNDIAIDENNTMWVATETSGLIQISNNVVVGRFGSSNSQLQNRIVSAYCCPSSRAVVNKISNTRVMVARLFIPSNKNNDDVMVVKTGGTLIDTPVNGSTKNTAIFTTNTNIAYNSLTSESTITLNNVIADNDILRGRRMILDGNFSNPITIKSSTGSTITVDGKIDSVDYLGNIITYNIAIFDTVQNNDYVLYCGNPRNIIQDLSVKLGQQISYFIYYKDSFGKYSPAFAIKFVPNSEIETTYNNAKVLLGCNNGLYEINKNDYSIVKLSNITFIGSLFGDDNFNVYIGSNTGVYSYNQINLIRTTPIIENSWSVFADSKHIVGSGPSGTRFVTISNNSKTEITKDFVIKPYINQTGQLNFSKIYSFNGKITCNKLLYNNYSDKFYMLSNSELYISKIYHLSWQKANIKNNDTLVDLIFNKTNSSVVMVGKNSILMSKVNDIFVFNTIIVGETINQRAIASTSNLYAFDGNNMFIAFPINSEISYDKNIQFLSFKLNKMPYLDYIYKDTSGFATNNNGQYGLAINSFSGVIYDAIYDIEIDANNNKLWAGGVNGLWYRSLPIDINEKWTKIGYYTLKYKIPDTQKYTVTNLTKPVQTSKHQNGILAIISTNGYSFNLVDSYNLNYKSSINKNIDSAIMIFKKDDATDAAIGLSKGCFKERDPYIVNQSFSKDMQSYYNQITSLNDYQYIQSNKKIVQLPTGIFNILTASNFEHIEQLLIETELFDNYYSDTAFKVGYSSISESFTQLSSAICSGFSYDYSVLDKYRPYHGMCAAFDTKDNDIIYVASFNPSLSQERSEVPTLSNDHCDLFKTFDGGRSWYQVNINKNIDGVKINNICIDPFDSETIYISGYHNVSTKNGIYVSRDGGISFEKINDGLADYPALSVYLKADGSVLYAGLDGLGLFSRNKYGYDYGYCYCYGYGYGYNSYGTDFFDIFEQSFVDSYWTKNISIIGQNNGVGLTNSIVSSIDVSDKNNDIIYVSTKKHGVIRTLDGGNNWSNFSTGLDVNTICTDIKVSDFNETSVWLGTNNGLYYIEQNSLSWVPSSVLSNKYINKIATNTAYKEYFISLSYKLPGTPMDGVMILRKEGGPIKGVPDDVMRYKLYSYIRDSFIVYYGATPTPIDGIVKFYDNINIKPNITYYYDFYAIKLDENSNPYYTKFPDIYTNEVNSITDNGIGIGKISGSVSKYSYNTPTDTTKIEINFDDDSIKHLNQCISNFKAIIDTGDEDLLELSINKCYINTIEFIGQYDIPIGSRVSIDMCLKENDLVGHILNPNIKQRNYVSSLNEELLYIIDNNTQYFIEARSEFDKIPIPFVPGLSTPKNSLFGSVASTIFTVSSSQALIGQCAQLLYVIADGELYVSTDGGKNFDRLHIYIGDSTTELLDKIESISFEQQDILNSPYQVRGWIATSNGLYFSENGFNNTVDSLSRVDGEYIYITIDKNDNKLIYAFKDGYGLIRSTDGGRTFAVIGSTIPIYSIEINSISYYKDYANKFLIGTTFGTYLLIDSINDTFEIKLETDGKFKNLNYKKLKIGDSIISDVNSIYVSSTTKANDINEQLNSIEFEASNGKYITMSMLYNNDLAPIDMIKIGSYQYNPPGNPTRIRIPNSFDEKIVGFSLKQNIDGLLTAGTNSGGYVSYNGKIWNKIENFLIPSIVYDLIKYNSGSMFIGTNNGLWVNSNPEKNLTNFRLKNQLNRKVKSLWTYNIGIKEIDFVGGEDGLRIKYKNFPYVIITTPNNFNPNDGIKIAWGAEDDNNKINAGGLDEELLNNLNSERRFVNYCMMYPVEVDALGFTGTVLVRWEGLEDSGFFPLNQVSYEARDRRYVNAVRNPTFDLVAEDEISPDEDKKNVVFPFPDGLVIVDDIRRRAEDAQSRSSIARIGEDTFTEDVPYIDTVSVNSDEDATSTYGAGSGHNGALLKANTTYIYTLFPYYERPPSFVFQSSGDECSWIRIYSKAKISEYSIKYDISSMPNAKYVTCGTSFDEFAFCVGTDDGVFYTDKNIGLRKAANTDGLHVNCMMQTSSSIDASNYSYVYGYGYGYNSGGIDFFDVFGVKGSGYGYGVGGQGHGNGFEMIIKNTIFIGTNNGIYKSSDGGKSFVNIFDANFFNVKSVFALTEDSNGNIYAGTDRGIFVKNQHSSEWSFNSVPGSIDFAPYGKYISQSFGVKE